MGTSEQEMALNPRSQHSLAASKRASVVRAVEYRCSVVQAMAEGAQSVDDIVDRSGVPSASITNVLKSLVYHYHIAVNEQRGQRHRYARYVLIVPVAEALAMMGGTPSASPRTAFHELEAALPTPGCILATLAIQRAPRRVVFDQGERF